MLKKPSARRERRNPVALFTLTALCAATLVACGGGGGDDNVARAPLLKANAAADCSGLTGRTIAASDVGEPTNGAVVTAAAYRAAAPETNNSTNTAVTLATPDYCEVLVDIRPVDPNAPVIKSQVNLPTNWNGKKMQFGGGGYNGTLQNALGSPQQAPLNSPRVISRGYVTAGTDSGHQNASLPEAYAFALNDESLVNFAYASYKKTHDVAVQLSQAYYGKRPGLSYYMGGSEGGREGMMMAQRYPQDYDGIIASDPVMNWTGLQTFGNWVGGILQSTPGAWLGNKTQLVHDTVVAACDALDGISDGVVSNYGACKPLADAALAAKRCASGADEGPTCLSDAQLNVIRAAHTGYTFDFPLANGMQSYAGFGYGGEGLAGNWSNWLVGTVAPTAGPAANGINQVYRFGNGYVRYFIARDPNFNPLAYNPNNFQSRVLQVSNLMDATNPDLTAFYNHGGKLILREDLSDTAQSPYTGLNYYNAVRSRLGSGATDEFFAAYVSTGLPHTSGGINPGSVNAPTYGIPGRVDLLPVLEDWVERGVRPANQYTLTNTTALQPFTVTASKPLCRYPAYPRYVGTSATGGADAANYACVTQ
jgi:feruloyl esterase